MLKLKQLTGFEKYIGDLNHKLLNKITLELFKKLEKLNFKIEDSNIKSKLTYGVDYYSCDLRGCEREEVVISISIDKPKKKDLLSKKNN